MIQGPRPEQADGRPVGLRVIQLRDSAFVLVGGGEQGEKRAYLESYQPWSGALLNRVGGASGQL
jgi:hypothetical protein